VADRYASPKTDSPLAASSLAGKRIVITRAVAQSSELLQQLSQHGAIPTSLPLVSFSAPQDYAPLDAALRRWQEFDWVLFTSANAVQSVVSRSAARGLALDQPGKNPRIAVVGPATKAEATKSALHVDHVAKTHLGTALGEELAAQLRDKIVFLPRSDRANPDLPAALKQLAAKLTEVVAYRTLPPSEVDRNHVTQVLGHESDAVIFFSPSAVHNLADLLGKQPLAELQNKIAIAAVGPVTSSTLREYGICQIVTALDTTATAVIVALESYFSAIATGQKPLAGAKHG
jgi:uroporphyrinogen III methyltransferase / synthase